MSLLKILDPILEVWLPTKWSRWTVGATIVLASFSSSLPEFLPLTGYTILEQYKLLVRLMLPTLTCLIGTFVVLLLVVRHSKTLIESHHNELEELKMTYENSIKQSKTKYETNKEKISTLSEKTISVLCEIADFENYVISTKRRDFCIIDILAMSKSLQMPHQELKYHLEQLTSANCIELYPSGKYGGLRQKGRELLYENGLLSDFTLTT